MNKINDSQKIVLRLVASSLFDLPLDEKELNSSEINFDEVFLESKKQTVSYLAYMAAKDFLPDSIKKEWQKTNDSLLVNFIKIEKEHTHLHKIMRENGIPYVIIKGAVSASYYKKSGVRTVGDIDFFVDKNDRNTAKNVLLSSGLVLTEDNKEGYHIAFNRYFDKERETTPVRYEMHDRVNNIPNDKVGKIIDSYFSDMIGCAKEFNDGFATFMMPNAFHHGLIMLLHTAGHMTHEGIGLRHMCDWACFIESMQSDEFVSLFKEKLEKVGLWYFAKLISAFCVEYLGCTKKDWIYEDLQSDYKLVIENMLCDVFEAGNFGHNDITRTRHIKYISNSDDNKISDKNTFAQLMKATKHKVKTNYPKFYEHKVLYPLGFCAVVFQYGFLVLRGKRKIDNSKKVISDANARKEIYRNFHLFEA